MMQVRKCPEGLWEEWALKDSSATFFQTKAWHSLVSPYMAGASAPLLFESGGNKAVLPLFHRKRLLWDFYQSPFGTYTALLCPEALPPYFLEEIRLWLGARNVELFSSPISRNTVAIGEVSHNATFLIDLEGLPEDFANAWVGSQRRYLRKAQEAGLRVRRAVSPEDVRAYLEIYGKSHARWDKLARGRYEDGLFHAIWGNLKDTESLRFWVTELEGRILGGAVCFYHNKHAVQWHSVVDPERFNLGGNQILLRHSIADAAARGYAYYDLNPSGGLEKVEAFKRDFGSRRVPFDNYASLSPGYARIRRIKGLLGRGA
jgi:hypothetical protein